MGKRTIAYTGMPAEQARPDGDRTERAKRIAMDRRQARSIKRDTVGGAR